MFCLDSEDVIITAEELSGLADLRNIHQAVSGTGARGPGAGGPALGCVVVGGSRACPDTSRGLIRPGSLEKRPGTHILPPFITLQPGSHRGQRTKICVRARARACVCACRLHGRYISLLYVGIYICIYIYRLIFFSRYSM